MLTIRHITKLVNVDTMFSSRLETIQFKVDLGTLTIALREAHKARNCAVHSNDSSNGSTKIDHGYEFVCVCKRKRDDASMGEQTMPPFIYSRFLPLRDRCDIIYHDAPSMFGQWAWSVISHFSCFEIDPTQL